MKNIYLTKRFKFSAAHRMYNGDFSKAENDKHFGICSNIHGHNYVL
jgi:6-pyruvoyltetrahydropterin/6-carboxytetrahydropterin synthase